MTQPMFEVDRKGLAQILARRGIEFAVLELIQNALDEPGVTTVQVTLEPIGRGYHALTVEDDAPNGFVDLSHAYTLFAPSVKKANPTQRGRFNLGEKLVLAMCSEARITTTTGDVFFDAAGRHTGRGRTKAGSLFVGTMRMSNEEAGRTEAAVHAVLCPPTIALSFNGKRLPSRKPLRTLAVSLPTEKADEEGFLRATRRLTEVGIYQVEDGESATLYEMGIPVVALDCAWHLDVGQKIPLNMDRDNVTPAYRRELVTAALNVMHDQLPTDQAPAPWVGEALESKDVSPEAVAAVLTSRYGDKRVVADPSDPEGTKIAVSQGYQVIQAGSFNAKQWDAIRRSKAALPAGQVTPSPKPFHPGGEPLKMLRGITSAHADRAVFIRRLARALGILALEIRYADDPEWGFAAVYKRGELTINAAAVGAPWFTLEHHSPKVLELLIHELAHHKVSDHLSEEFHQECCRLGARCAELAIERPDVFASRGIQ